MGALLVNEEGAKQRSEAVGDDIGFSDNKGAN